VPKLKIVIIGGGSYGWTPTIVRDLVVTPELEGSTIVLEDINPEPLKLTGPMAKKIVKQSRRDFTIETTTREADALAGADYVVLTISTGGFDTMEHDLKVPLKYGIYQSVGDTVGPGGISRSLRNIPVVVDIGRRMEKLCPNAWMLNYTNPLTTLSRALTRETSIRTIGLCHELYGGMSWLVNLFGLESRHDFDVVAAGVNHCIWILKLTIKETGEDALALMRRYLEDPDGFMKARKAMFKGKKAKIEQLTHAETHGGKNLAKSALFRIYGALPAGGDRHVAEFFPFFLTREADEGKRWGVALTTIEERRNKWAPDAKRWCEKLLSGEEKINLERSGETASLIINALSGGERFIDVMNLPNKGQVGNLPRESCVETMAVADTNGTHGICVGDLPLGVLNQVMRHLLNQELTIEAALTGDRDLVLQAMLNDPLVRNLEDAKAMTDELLENNKKYLPLFFKKRGR
jgi:alpha-galactosidase